MSASPTSTSTPSLSPWTFYTATLLNTVGSMDKKSLVQYMRDLHITVRDDPNSIPIKDLRHLVCEEIKKVFKDPSTGQASTEDRTRTET